MVSGLTGYSRDSENRSWSPTQLQVERMLHYLRSPDTYTKDVRETFVEEEHELFRKVTIEMLIPGVQDEEKVDDLLFIALMPRKNVDFSVEAKSIDGKISFRRLGHLDHIAVSKALIITRFWTLVESIRMVKMDDPLATAPLVSLDPLQQAISQLIQLPSIENVDSAEDIIRSNFDSEGKLRALEGLNVDFNQMVLFYKLCRILASRWLTIFRVPLEPGSNDVMFCYEYRRPFEERFPNRLSRVRKGLSGAPFEFKIHVPMARVSPSYTASIAAPKGLNYKKSILVADTNPRTRPSSANRVWGETSNSRFEREMVPLSDRKYSDVSSTGQASNLFLRDGHLEDRRLYLYVKMYETPPGTLLHSGFSLTLLLSALVWSLAFLISRDSEVPSYTPVLVALSTSVVTIAATYWHPFVDSSRPSVAPRLISIVQLLLTFTFVFWILSSPNRPRPKHVDGTTDVGLVLVNVWFGFMVLVCVTLCCGFIWYRFWRSLSTHKAIQQQIEFRRRPGWANRRPVNEQGQHEH